MRHYIFTIIGVIWGSFIMAQSVSKELATQVALKYMMNDISNAAPKDFSLLTKNHTIDTTYTTMFSPRK